MITDVISISILDNSVTVNGETYEVDLSAHDLGAFDVIFWGAGAECFTQKSPGVRVTTFEGAQAEYDNVVAPYVALWQMAKDEATAPPPEPTEEDLYNEERARVEMKYSSPWNGETGGILSTLQMTLIAAFARGEDITEISQQYQNELAAMNAEFSAIDEKYGVA